MSLWRNCIRGSRCKFSTTIERSFHCRCGSRAFNANNSVIVCLRKWPWSVSNDSSLWILCTTLSVSNKQIQPCHLEKHEGLDKAEIVMGEELRVWGILCWREAVDRSYWRNERVSILELRLNSDFWMRNSIITFTSLISSRDTDSWLFIFLVVEGVSIHEHLIIGAKYTQLRLMSMSLFFTFCSIRPI